MRHCYTSVMRFWLRWAAVTLPFAAFVFLWVQSYWFADTFQWDRPNRVIVFRFNDGALDLAISYSKPPPGSVSSRQNWSHTRGPRIKGGSSVNRRVLGFGLERVDFLPNFSLLSCRCGHPPFSAPSRPCGSIAANASAAKLDFLLSPLPLIPKNQSGLKRAS